MDEGQQPSISPIGHIVADVTASRGGRDDACLPLPPLLASAFAWAVDLDADRAPITLTQLCDPRFVYGLSSEDRQRCSAAVRYALDAEVKYGQLPSLLMNAPIDPDWDEEVRSFLSTRGWARDRQPPELTIEHARAYIGRRTNRLLELLPARATGGHPPALSEAQKIRLITAPVWFQPRPERIGSDSRGKGARPPSDPVSEQERRQRKIERRKSQLDDLHWHFSRLQQSEAVQVTVGPGESVTAQDPRLGRLLLEIDQAVGLRGQSLDELATSTSNDLQLAALVQELMARVAKIRTLSASGELQELLDALLPDRPSTKQSKVRSRDLVAARYGVGGAAMTLQEVGDVHGITRERVRQLQETFDARLSVGTVFVPQLELVRVELAQTEFAPLSVLREKLAPLLGEMPLESALDLMQRVMGWPVQGRIAMGQRNPQEDELLVWTQDLTAAAVSSVMQQAYAMSMMVGGFLVTAIIGLVAEHAGRFVTRDQIHQILGAWRKAHWIDEESGWGWVDGIEKSPVISDIRKILAVAHPISVDIAVLYGGLSTSRRQAVRGERMNRFSGLLAPRWVVDHVLRQLAEFEVAQQDNFRLRTTVDPISLMEGDTEPKIYAALRARGGIASWVELKDELVTRQGVNFLTFGVFLKNRCWVDQPGYGIYCLRGLRIEIGQVRARGMNRLFESPSARSTQSRTATTQTLPVRGQDAGEPRTSVTLEVRMTAMAHDTPYRVVNIPQRFRDDMLAGAYLAQDGSGRTIHVGRTQISRLPDELEQAGLAAGDAVLVCLDVAQRLYSWRRSVEHA